MIVLYLNGVYVTECEDRLLAETVAKLERKEGIQVKTQSIEWIRCYKLEEDTHDR